MRHVRLAVVLGLLASLLLPAVAQAAFPGRDGRIAYSRLVNGAAVNWEIVTLNRDGSGYQSMTFNPEIDDNPTFSPDGTQIAFDSDVSGDVEVYTVEDSPAFRPSIRLTSSPGYDGEPAWSPDGTKIAFRKGEGSAAEIWVMNADGTGQAQVTSNVSFDGGPAWSPDGTMIAFHSDRDDPLAYELYTMEPGGTNVTRLTTSAGEDANPNWHPDGSKLLFDSDRGGQTEVYVMDASVGAPATQLTDSPYETSGSAWSPDGTKIVFAYSFDVLVANADGTGVTPIVPEFGRRLSQAPDWQPLPGPEPPVPYDHPASASTLRVPLVPEFRQTISTTQCEARGGSASMHGSPLSFASCEPPGFLPGTQAHLGAQGTSYVQISAGPSDISTAPNEADIGMSAVLTDVRDGAGADYQSSSFFQLRVLWRGRLSDLGNGTRHQQPGTTTDFESVPRNTPQFLSCAPTMDPATGSSCSGQWSPNSSEPNIFEGRSTVVQLYRVRVKDSGANGRIDDPDDRQFASQGIYIP